MTPSILVSCLAALLLTPADGDEMSIDPALHHLGNDRVEKWKDVPADPEGTRLDLEFGATKNVRESVLCVYHRDIHDPWHIEINGRRIGDLKRTVAGDTYYYAIPLMTLRTGSNSLAIFPDRVSDDIVIGKITITSQPLRTVLHLGRVDVTVKERGTGRLLPARVTVVSAKGDPADLYYTDAATTAVRAGLSYTRGGSLQFEVAAGEYDLFATRGTEWSLGQARITVPESGDVSAVLEVTREVDTTGYVACDTHIHTLTYSGHGDSSMEERMITLAGEGIELAIATDHNHHTDYAPLQREMELTEWFTPVVGNEVTTDVGHFNAFPLDPQGEVPPYKLDRWVKIVEGSRERGAKVVILNHPRWPSIEKGPFGVVQLDQGSGAFLEGGQVMTVDCIELINSGFLVEDPLLKYRDWFALLNRGGQFTAIGSSDSHTVGDPVGQGRTYVRSSTDDPAKIDVDEACRSFLEGTTSVSLGIFTMVHLDGHPAMGGRFPLGGQPFKFWLRVAAASWIRPRQALVFLNGIEVERHELLPEEGKAMDVDVGFRINAPQHDAYLVCVVLGDPVTGPFWKTGGPYTLGSTNPILLDADGDQRYLSPRETASNLLRRAGADLDRLRSALAGCDDAVGIQLIDLACEKGGELRELLPRLTGIRPALARFLEQRLAR